MSCDYENPWYFEGSPFLSEDINDLYGFVYRITNLQNGRQYIKIESTSGLSEKVLEVSLGELKVRATGRNTTEVLTNLIRNANGLGMMPLDVRS